MRSLTLTENESGVLAEGRCFPDGIIFLSTLQLPIRKSVNHLSSYKLCWVNFLRNRWYQKPMFACSCYQCTCAMKRKAEGETDFPLRKEKMSKTEFIDKDKKYDRQLR